VKGKKVMQEKIQLQLPKASSDLVVPCQKTPGTPGKSSLKAGSPSGRHSVSRAPALPSPNFVGKVKSVAILVDEKHTPTDGYFNLSQDEIKQTSVLLDEEDEENEDEQDEELVGKAQGVGSHAPKHSKGNMSRMSKNSKNSAASSDRG
jgi:hypothetical protein